jgi:hypothetical protein
MVYPVEVLRPLLEAVVLKKQLKKAIEWLVQKCYLTYTPIVGYALQRLFNEIFC